MFTVWMSLFFEFYFLMPRLDPHLVLQTLHLLFVLHLVQANRLFDPHLVPQTRLDPHLVLQPRLNPHLVLQTLHLLYVHHLVPKYFWWL